MQREVPTAGAPRAEAAVSANTAAVLLLTSSLAEGDGRASPDLLTADEYNRLAVQLRQIDKAPSDLMAKNAWHLIDGAQNPWRRSSSIDCCNVVPL